MNRFPCNQARCLVQCGNCPSGAPCVHMFTCECKKYAYSNMCKHIHILAMLRDNSLSSPESIQNQPDLDDIHAINATLGDTSDPPVGENEVNQGLNHPPEFNEHVRKFDQITAFMSSTNYNNEAKYELLQQLKVLPLEQIEVKLNPETFPRMVRKRNHDPQNRSFFPKRKKNNPEEG